MPKRLFQILLMYVFSMGAAGQTSAIDSSNKTAFPAICLYYQSLGTQSPLYNGSEYLDYAYTLQKGHPFFESTDFADGIIRYDGMEFQNVPMLYDIVKDQVIIQHFNKVHKINLQSDKIEWFSLLGHTFISITDSTHQLKDGFYDRLYNGKLMLLAKREKKIREDHSGFTNIIANVIDEKNYYYIKKDGIYYSLKNMRTLLYILRTKKKEIQQYFSKNKIKFKADPERAMILAAQYYDGNN